MKIHEVKEWPSSFDELISGHRAFEVRYNDRQYAARDVLAIKEWRPEPDTIEVPVTKGSYTGEQCYRRVERVHTSPHLRPGYVILEVSILDCPYDLTAEGKRAIEESREAFGLTEALIAHRDAARNGFVLAEPDGMPASAPANRDADETQLLPAVGGGLFSNVRSGAVDAVKGA